MLILKDTGIQSDDWYLALDGTDVVLTIMLKQGTLTETITCVEFIDKKISLPLTRLRVAIEYSLPNDNPALLKIVKSLTDRNYELVQEVASLKAAIIAFKGLEK